MILNLPIEIVVVITSYLDFKKEDLFNCRLVNNEYKKIMDDPISSKGYPYLIKCSFFAFTMDYHEVIEEKRQREVEAHNEFIAAYRLMLMDFGWL